VYANFAGVVLIVCPWTLSAHPAQYLMDDVSGYSTRRQKMKAYRYPKSQWSPKSPGAAQPDPPASASGFPDQ
jgi:hypothetical protein